MANTYILLTIAMPVSFHRDGAIKLWDLAQTSAAFATLPSECGTLCHLCWNEHPLTD